MATIEWRGVDPDGFHHTKAQRAGKYDCYGSVWYGADGGFCWAVWWSGYHVRAGSGHVSAADARREVEILLGEILAGNMAEPWLDTLARQSIAEQLRLLREPKDDMVTVYFGGIPCTGTIKV